MRIAELFTVAGRLNRQAYWGRVVVAWGAMFMLSIAFIFVNRLGSQSGSEDNVSTWIAAGIYFVAIFACLAVGFVATVRRLHDRNRSGWWVIPLWTAPAVMEAVVNVEAGEHGPLTGPQIMLSVGTIVLGLWGFLEIGCLIGTKGANQFGPDPLETVDPYRLELPPRDQAA